MEKLIVEVSRMYLKLQKLDKRDVLLSYIRRVSPDGRFYWNERKERSNGKRVRSWVNFYKRFSGGDLNGLTEREIGPRLPGLLGKYYEALKDRVDELEKRN